VLRKFPNTQEYKIIKYQLIKSSSSSGANYEEAQGGSSRADFKNKAFISLKEMRESNYWLKVLQGISDDEKTKEENIRLINESEELKNILGSIVSKIK
jgi:four helix bundle protein